MYRVTFVSRLYIVIFLFPTSVRNLCLSVTTTPHLPLSIYVHTVPFHYNNQSLQWDHTNSLTHKTTTSCTKNTLKHFKPENRTMKRHFTIKQTKNTCAVCDMHACYLFLLCVIKWLKWSFYWVLSFGSRLFGRMTYIHYILYE